MKSLWSFRRRGFVVLICLMIAWMCAAIGWTEKITCEQTGSKEIKCEKLKDGVEHWFLEAPQDGRSGFFRHMEQLFEVILPNQQKLPFGKSVALLVGVSQYAHIEPDLPFVQNDLEDMRNFLLGKGGFDEVYVACEEIVNSDLIQRYMKQILPKKLAPEDRLLFYYAGHGDDEKGITSYMQFSQAKPGEFFGSQVLKIAEAEMWSSLLDLRHLLVMFDCCASGLAFAPRGEKSPTVAQVLTTLSKNGSRIVITAGTAKEKTFEVRQGGRGNGIFTRAFLNAVELGNADLDTGGMEKDGLITVEEIMAQIESEIAVFEARYKKRISPRQWDLNPNTYPGTFLFLNPDIKNQKIPLNTKYAAELGAELFDRGGEIIGVFGEIQIISYVTGDVYIDRQPMDRIERGESKAYDLPPGNHIIELRTGEQRLVQEIEVLKGGIHPIKFRPTVLPTPESPIPTPTAFPSSEGSGVGKAWTDPVTGMEFVWIEGGCFQMGQTQAEKSVLIKEVGEEDCKKYYARELPRHEVCVDGFWMGKYELTNAQYRKFKREHDSKDYKGHSLNGEEQPAVYVSWEDAKTFTEWLTQQHGGKYTFRLPTEAEWEYTARAGTTTSRYWGDNPDDACQYANVYDQTAEKAFNWGGTPHDCNDGYAVTAMVGSFRPNAFGLYDMLGNVWEWCEDWYDKNYYASSPPKNPNGPSSGNYRLLRGGSWSGAPSNVRGANRGSNHPAIRLDNIGFRVVLVGASTLRGQSWRMGIRRVYRRRVQTCSGDRGNPVRKSTRVRRPGRQSYQNVA